MLDLYALQSLYDQNRFLQAYHRCAPLLSPDTDLDEHSIEALVFFSRLASRIGSPRLRRHLARQAAKRAPRHPLVRYFAPHVGRRPADTFDILLDFVQDPELETDDRDLRSSWFAYQAVCWAEIRDFENASACLKRAKAIQPEDPWVLSCEADILLLADHWEEALRAARRAWTVGPGKPYAAQSLGQSLIKCGRLGEAARRLFPFAVEGESLEITVFVCWLNCAWSETLSGIERMATINQAKVLAARFPELAPRPDREVEGTFSRAWLDIADLEGDHAALERWAQTTGSPYYRQILENHRRNPNGRRILLPHRKVPQKHDTCLPSSLAAALSALNVTVNEDEIAQELTFGGTHTWAAVEWLEKQGMSVRQFLFTPETGTALIRNGIPFLLSLEYESHSHAVAAIGVDEATGTLIIHDPSATRQVEILLNRVGVGEHPLGPRAMVATPTAMALFLDQLIPEKDRQAASLLQNFFRAQSKAGTAAARQVVDEAVKTRPEHLVTRYLEAVQQSTEGRVGESVSALQKLLREHPGCLCFRRSLLRACNATGNTALIRETLADVVEKGRLPGVQADQAWSYPPATYVAQYADQLRFTETHRPHAKRLLRQALRLQPDNSELWHNLADLLWHDGPSPAALLAYRAAANTSTDREHYAQAYVNALQTSGHEEAALRWVEERARRLGASPLAVGPWATWVNSLEEFGRPERALTAHEEVTRQHADTPEWLAFSIPFQCRMGKWEDAETELRRLQALAPPDLFAEAAVHYHQRRGEWAAALPFSRQWVEEAPNHIPARQSLLEITEALQSSGAAREQARQWAAEQPGHDDIEEILYNRLESNSARLDLLTARVARNAEDGWAWREIAFLRIEAFEVKSLGEREALCPAITATIAECDRTAPRNLNTLRVHAAWEEAQGHWEQAMALWLEIVALDPEIFQAYRQAWKCAANLPQKVRENLLAELEGHLERCVGHLHIARELLFLVAERFGPAVAEAKGERWRSTHPDDPEVAEAVADLWLEYGRGRSDAEKAWEILVDAVKRFPCHSDLRFSLAHAYQSLGRDEDAEQVLHEIHRRHPANTATMFRLARIHERRGDLSGADAWLDRATRVAPRSGEVWNELIRFLLRQDRREEAKTLIRRGVAEMPDSVFRRECAIDHMVGLGEKAEAITLAREGVRIYPDGAYLWFILGRTLAEFPEAVGRGEAEACYRRALELNVGLFEATDLLTVLLAEERRIEEAIELLQEIRPLMKDPSLADGRLAWLQRIGSDPSLARETMARAVAAAPWYSWGWDKLLKWLEEDSQWDEARRLLCPSPPAMSAQASFRTRRLVVLTAAGLSPAELEEEWDLCLHDYPEDLGIHLDYYDALWVIGRREKASAALQVILDKRPEDPFAQARHVVVLVGQTRLREAVEACLNLLFRPDDDYNWPTDHAWLAVAGAGCGREVYQAALKRLADGQAPPPQAIRRLGLTAKRMQEEKIEPLPWRQNLLAGAGCRELLGLLKIVDQAAGDQGYNRATLLEYLSDLGCQRRVVRYAKRHPDRVAAHTETWAQVGRALNGIRSSKAVKFMQDWRERTGLKMWMVTNVVLALLRRRPTGDWETLSVCREALRTLPHDHTARYLAHVLAETAALKGDLPVFQEVWSRYGGYFEGAVEKGEFFFFAQRYLLKLIPEMGRVLEKGDRTAFQRLLKTLRKLVQRQRWASRRERVKVAAVLAALGFFGAILLQQTGVIQEQPYGLWLVLLSALVTYVRGFSKT